MATAQSKEASELASEISAGKRTLRTVRSDVRAKATRLKALREQCERFGIELVIVPLPEGRPSSPGETAAITQDVRQDLQDTYPSAERKGAHSGYSNKDAREGARAPADP